MNLFVINVDGNVHRIRAVTMDQAWKKIYPNMTDYNITTCDRIGKRFKVYCDGREIAKITKIPRRQL